MSYLYYNCRKAKTYIEALPEEVRKNFCTTQLLQREKPQKNVMYVPLVDGLRSFTSVEEALKFLNALHFAFENPEENLIFLGDDFDLVLGEYTDEFIQKNMEKFFFDFGDSVMFYSEELNIDKSHLRYCCQETIGDTEDRVADLYKMIEILLLATFDKLTTEEMEILEDKISSISPSKDLVVSRKYQDIVSFVDVFLQREQKARKILDKKY
jgi:hypothetical protein